MRMIWALLITEALLGRWILSRFSDLRFAKAALYIGAVVLRRHVGKNEGTGVCYDIGGGGGSMEFGPNGGPSSLSRSVG